MDYRNSGEQNLSQGNGEFSYSAKVRCRILEQVDKGDKYVNISEDIRQKKQISHYQDCLKEASFLKDRLVD